MKKRIIITVAIVIIVVAILVTIAYFVEKSKNSINYQDGIEIASNLSSAQKDVDDEINSLLNNEDNTFDNPFVLKNPYLISPLTALIIFQTKNNVSYQVYINDVLFTKTDSSTKHCIPIYGLVAGKENNVKLVGSDNTSKNIPIEKKKYNYNVKIDQSTVNENNDFYFISSPTDIGHIAINSKGEVVWYFNTIGGQDIEFLSNGHLLITNNVVSTEDSFTGFYEVDFLGKIYKSYSLKNGYHHEVNELSNGNLIVAGDKLESKFQESYIYIIDKDSGEEISSLDLYDIFSNIDEAFTKSLGEKDLINNSIDYN